MSRSLVTRFYTEYVKWTQTGYFDKSALISDSNPLTQDEMVALNTLLGELGCLDNATQQLMTIYVDAVNGSDVTGDGSTAHPYASLAFLNIFPKYINHRVRVLILEDLDMGTDALNLNFVIGPDGCFSLAGRSAPTTITTSAGAGPFTITNVANYGTPGTSDYAHVMTFAETWAVDELYGKWVKFLSGSNNGQAYQIHSNQANTILFRGGCFANPAIGNTIQVIEPTITVKCQRINLECSGPQNVYTLLTPTQGLDACRLNVMNLNLDLRGTYTESSQLVLKSSVETQISFVNVVTDNSMADSVLLKSNLNQYPSSDIDIATYTLSSISNIDCLGTAASACGILFENSDFLPAVFTFTSVIIDGANIVRCIDTRGSIRLRNNVRTFTLNCGGIIIGYQSPVCDFSRNIVDGEASSHSISLIECGSWHISKTYFSLPGLNVFNIQGVRLKVDLSTISFSTIAVFTGFAFNYSFLETSDVITADSTATIAGVTANDIWFPGGVGITAFPGADAQANNLLGCTFNYIASP